jgi:hypothetical protein
MRAKAPTLTPAEVEEVGRVAREALTVEAFGKFLRSLPPTRSIAHYPTKDNLVGEYVRGILRRRHPSVRWEVAAVCETARRSGYVSISAGRGGPGINFAVERWFARFMYAAYYDLGYFDVTVADALRVFGEATAGPRRA